MTKRLRGRRIAVVAACVALLAASLSAQTRGQMPPGLDTGPYDVTRLKLGTKATVVVLLAVDKCDECVASMGFYKSLMKRPELDGKSRAVVVVAMDGVWPVKTVTDAHGFKPHRLHSGPYPRRPVPGVAKAPTVLVLDAKGVLRGKWAGLLDAAQQKEVIAALLK